MFITIPKQFYLLIMITVITDQTYASKCGLLNCDAQAECKYNRNNDEFYCVCEKGLVPNIQGNNIQCHRPDLKQCLKAGAECGHHHICNTELVCQEMEDNDVAIVDVAGQELVCSPQEQKCLDKCCLENEICQNGITCIIRETAAESSMAAIESECPENQKCLNSCCAHNEVCSEDKKCIINAIPSLVSELDIPLCLDSQQCQGKCCAENETCLNGLECVAKEEDDVDCPKSEKCLNKCCASTEICRNGTQCVAKESSAMECAQEQVCSDRCCAEQEICTNENVCISKDIKLANQSNLEQECPEEQQCENKCCALNEKCNSRNECVMQEAVVLACPESLKCLNKCCAENEVCDSGEACVSQTTIEQEWCPKFRKCQNECCAINQICNNENECEEDEKKEVIISPSDISSNGSINCSENQKCLGKCNGTQECPPLNTGECHEMCGNKCCPINETCNDANECVIFIEVTTSQNCPEHLQCLNDCCSSQQICNDLNRCVNKNLEEISNLYDFSKEEVLGETHHANNIEPIIPLTDMTDKKEEVSCPRDHYPCQHTCCNTQQICNPLGECVEQLNDSDPVCIFEKNCTENAKATKNISSITYTMIGLGCLVTVLTFALFKLYNFRRTQRNLF